MRTFTLLMVTLALTISSCQEKQKEKKLVEYDTKTVFIFDDRYKAVAPSKNDINFWTRQGWEIESSRRAFAKDYSTYPSSKNCGTEYIMQRPIYKEE